MFSKDTFLTSLRNGAGSDPADPAQSAAVKSSIDEPPGSVQQQIEWQSFRALTENDVVLAGLEWLWCASDTLSCMMWSRPCPKRCAPPPSGLVPSGVSTH